MTPELRPAEHPAPARVAARHTLGSDPDGAGAPVRLSGEPPAEREPPPPELARPVWWLAAQQSSASWSGLEAAKLAARIVAQVNGMWSVIDELEALYTAVPRRPSHERDLFTHFLSFVERDLVGLFVDLARQVGLVLSSGGGLPWDPAAFDGEGERFARNLDVMRLAASDPVIPESARSVVQRSARHLSESFPDFAALVGALAALCRFHGH
jgi:hypothetical protein